MTSITSDVKKRFTNRFLILLVLELISFRFSDSIVAFVGLIVFVEVLKFTRKQFMPTAAVFFIELFAVLFGMAIATMVFGKAITVISIIQKVVVGLLLIYMAWCLINSSRLVNDEAKEAETTEEGE